MLSELLVMEATAATGPLEVVTEALKAVDTSVFLPMFAAVIGVIAVPTIGVIAAKKGWSWAKRGIKSIG